MFAFHGRAVSLLDLERQRIFNFEVVFAGARFWVHHFAQRCGNGLDQASKCESTLDTIDAQVSVCESATIVHLPFNILIANFLRGTGTMPTLRTLTGGNGQRFRAGTDHAHINTLAGREAQFPVSSQIDISFSS
jgi:hypothetical protein